MTSSYWWHTDSQAVQTRLVDLETVENRERRTVSRRQLLSVGAIFHRTEYTDTHTASSDLFRTRNASTDFTIILDFPNK